MSTGPPPPNTQPPAAGGPPPAPEPPPAEDHGLVVPKTRTSSTWVGVAVGLVLLLLVIIFIWQNTADAPLHFLWLHGRVPIGLAVLLAFVLGGIAVLLIGAARLTQLRLMARRYRRQDPAARRRSATSGEPAPSRSRHTRPGRPWGRSGRSPR